MKDERTELQRFIDLARALVRVPRKEVAAQPVKTTRPQKTRRAKPS